MNKLFRCQKCGHMAVRIDGCCSLCGATVIDEKPALVDRLRQSLVDAISELNRLHAFLQEADEKDLVGLYAGTAYWRNQVEKVSASISGVADSINAVEELADGAVDRHFLKLVGKKP